MERRGPRVAATAAALFFGSGLLIGGIGLALRQSVLVFLGMGFIGGIGCGLGYISPVSTLVKWFPDRRGMATGMAIMGFGGGALLAGYLNVYFMNLFGVARTVMTLGVCLSGDHADRRAHPAPSARRAGGRTAGPRRRKTNKMITARSVSRNDALGDARSSICCGAFCSSTSRPGIGILAQASPMMQDLFQKTALEAGAVVSLISAFNAGGRFFWASSSDYIGRRNTYTIFFVVQFVLFLLIPGFAASGAWAIFRGQPVRSIHHVRRRILPPSRRSWPIFSDADNVGAIHGALLTAWSAAAVAGPVIITELSNRAKARSSAGREPRSHLRSTAGSARGDAGRGVRPDVAGPTLAKRHAEPRHGTAPECSAPTSAPASAIEKYSQHQQGDRHQTDRR